MIVRPKKNKICVYNGFERRHGHGEFEMKEQDYDKHKEFVDVVVKKEIKPKKKFEFKKPDTEVNTDG
jgi:hypothetical protein